MDTGGTADPNTRSDARVIVLNGAMRVAISTTQVTAFFNSAVIGPIDAFVGTPTPEAGTGFRQIGSTQPEPSGLAVSWPLGASIAFRRSGRRSGGLDD